MKLKIKQMYEAAGTLHAQAKSILDEYEGKELPAEKAQEVDRLLDQVEARTSEAKRLERMVEQEALLQEPATRLPGPDGGDGEKQGMAPEGKAVNAAFQAYLRKGPRGLTLDEIKALAQDEDTAGGYLVSDTFRAALLLKSRERSAVRRISRVLPPIPGGSSITPTEDSDLGDPTWTTEIGSGDEDTVKPFGRRVLTPHPFARRIKVSNTLLRSSAVDVEAWVREQLAYRFAVVEENGFLNGSGAREALGLLNTASLPTYTTAVSNTVGGDDLVNWIYRLPSAYAGNGRVLCNRAFIRKIRLLKDGNGQYLWQPGLQGGSPSTILDTPYETSDRFDDGLDSSDAWEDDAVIAVVGDFRYYWIVDSLNLTIQRLSELYAETNETGFIGRKEADGMVVLTEAFYALKVKA